MNRKQLKSLIESHRIAMDATSGCTSRFEAVRFILSFLFLTLIRFRYVIMQEASEVAFSEKVEFAPRCLVDIMGFDGLGKFFIF